MSLRCPFCNSDTDINLAKCRRCGKWIPHHLRRARTQEDRDKNLVRYRLQCGWCDYIWETRYPRIPSQCPACNKKIYTSGNYTVLTRKVSGCFIATAAFGSELAPPVQFLREFRDNMVLKSRYSRVFEKFLDVYYIFSPPIAKAMMENEALKFVIKYIIVLPFVKFSQACAIIIGDARANRINNKTLRARA